MKTTSKKIKIFSWFLLNLGANLSWGWLSSLRFFIDIIQVKKKKKFTILPQLVHQTINLSPSPPFISSLISPILTLLTGDPDDWDVLVMLVSLLVMLDWVMEPWNTRIVRNKFVSLKYEPDLSCLVLPMQTVLTSACSNKLSWSRLSSCRWR